MGNTTSHPPRIHLHSIASSRPDVQITARHWLLRDPSYPSPSTLLLFPPTHRTITRPWNSTKQDIPDPHYEVIFTCNSGKTAVICFGSHEGGFLVGGNILEGRGSVQVRVVVLDERGGLKMEMMLNGDGWVEFKALKGFLWVVGGEQRDVVHVRLPALMGDDDVGTLTQANDARRAAVEGVFY